MKKLSAISLMLILLNVVSSCKKNKDTDIEIIQYELNQFIKDNNITKCDIVVILGDQYVTYHSNVSFSIDNGFVVIRESSNTDSFNLLSLLNYTLQTVGEKKIIMFFST